MELHGNDLCVVSVEIPLTAGLINILVEDHWPDMTYEMDFREGDIEHGLEVNGYDMFIYKNEDARKAWDKDGWSEENDTTMIHAMWNYEKPHEVWFVIDDSSKNKYIIDDIEQFIRKCEHGRV